MSSTTTVQVIEFVSIEALTEAAAEWRSKGIAVKRKGKLSLEVVGKCPVESESTEQDVDQPAPGLFLYPLKKVKQAEADAKSFRLKGKPCTLKLNNLGNTWELRILKMK